MSNNNPLVACLDCNNCVVGVYPDPNVCGITGLTIKEKAAETECVDCDDFESLYI